MFTHRLSPNSELRLLQPYHAEEVFLLIDANREYLRRWLLWVNETNTVDDVQAFRKRTLEAYAHRGDIVAGIWHEGRFAGIIGLEDINSHCGTGEIGYWLGEEFQGKGLVTMACRALIDHGFRALQLNRIQIRVEPENLRSNAIPRRLGFTYEGTLRQIVPGFDGPANLEVYSLLKEEWGKSSGTEGATNLRKPQGSD